MRHLKFAYLLVGIAILVLVAGEIELEEVGALVIQVGWGFAVVVGVYFLAFVIDSFSWQLALTGVPLDAAWLYRMWKVRMVGEVFNNVLPAAGMGGEPVKAVLLKKHYAIGYRESTASLILAKTINLIALVAFLGTGFILMVNSQALPGSFKSVAGLGLGAFALGIFLFFGVQRLKITSLTGSWIGRRRLGRRIEELLHHVRDMDDRLAGFYSGHGVRFAGAVGLALVNWLLGAVEIYITMIFLDRPISFTDAWIIEAAAQLVRAGTFFIPASIGAQEGVFLLIYGAMTGSPTLGAAVAVVRRLREIMWILWGLLLGSIYTFEPAGDE
jgi:uncharacterized protein (TIRG00374 family)